MIKKSWLTEAGGDLFALSFESKNPHKEHMKIHARDLTFPEKPTKEHPLRHTLVVGLFDFNDLRKIRNSINDLLIQYNEYESGM